MAEQMTDPSLVIQKMMPGIMIYARLRVKGKDLVAFLIRETSSAISRLGASPILEVRAGIVPEGRVSAVLIMVRVGGRIYESWLNVYQSGSDGFLYLETLAVQDQLVFVFYGDKQRSERKLAIQNSLKVFAQDALQELQATVPWSMKDFDKAKDALYDRYPTGEDLWQALGQPAKRTTKATAPHSINLPRVDVVSLSGIPVSPALVRKDIHDGMSWARWSAKHSVIFRSVPVSRLATGVVGVGDQIAIRFLFDRNSDPVAALHDVEEQGDLSPIVAGAVTGAVRGLSHKITGATLNMGVDVLATVCSASGDRLGHSSLSNREVNSIAEQFVAAIVAGQSEVQLPGGAVDRARFWLAVGQLLWKPSLMWQLAETGAYKAVMDSQLTSGAAIAWLALSGKRTFDVNGTNYSFASLAVLRTLWRQVLEWTVGKVPGNALQWLVQGHDAAWSVDLTRKQTPVEWNQQNDDLADAIARSLVEEAEDHAVFVPLGAFRVNLPDGVPLRMWGARTLRIWATPDGMWVQALASGPGGPSFWWSPHDGVYEFVISASARPAVESTLAALWRDLRIAGEKAMPERSGRQAHGKKRNRARRTNRVSQHARILPARKGAFHLTGRHDWSTKDEQERIHHRAHGVRGHLRQLHAGWQASDEAHRIAHHFGVSVPQGYTFVRPHVRGGGEEQEAAQIKGETPIVARGLATLVSLLGR